MPFVTSLTQPQKLQGITISLDLVVPRLAFLFKDTALDVAM